MKNFPHQYNQLSKLRGTLAAALDLNAAGESANNDGVLGFELARRQIYGFRSLDVSGDDAEVRARIEERLREEERKPADSRGTETAAREMRRTLRYLGWLASEGTELTSAGEALLAASEGSDEERALIQEALLRIEVVDGEGSTSHPMRLLLRLIDEVPLHSRAGMELALEAKDDSVAEYERIVRLAELSDDDRRQALGELGWTKAQIANAVKILPAFALQADLMIADATGRYVLTDRGRRALGRGATSVPVSPEAVTGAAPVPTRSPVRRRTSIETKNANEVGQARRLRAAARRALSAEEQAAAAEQLYERTDRHQSIVRQVAQWCATTSTFYEDPASYDLLVDLGDTEPLHLIEVKSVVDDAEVQVRTAIGQLLYYEYFNVRPAFPGRVVQKSVVVDREVPHDLGQLLDELDIALILASEDGPRALNETAKRVLSRLFP